MTPTAPRAAGVREGLLQLVVAGLGVLAPRGGAGAAEVVLVVLWTAAALLLRHRRPAAALVAVAPLVSLDVPGVGLAAVVVAVTQGRREVGARRHLLVLALAGALCLAAAPLVPTGESVGFTLLDAALSVVVLLWLPALCGAVVGRRRLATRLLRDRNDHLERERSLVARQVRLEEQARMVGEMHDVLGHRLSLLSVHAGALEVTAGADAPRLTGQARLVRSTAVAALDDLRAVLVATGDPSGTRGVPPGGPAPGCRAQVQELAEGSRRAGAEVDLDWQADDAPPAPDVGRAVDRAVREGLTNAGKHAPGAPVTVCVLAREGRVVVRVRNGPPTTGRGGEPAQPRPSTRLGLRGLAERAAALGGRASWSPTPDGGFELLVEVPSDPPAARDRGTSVPTDLAAADLAAAGAAAPVRRADVLSGRRVAVVVAVAAVVWLPVTIALALAVAAALVLVL